MKSDVVPVIEAGGWGVYVPHDLTWDLEHHEAPQNAARYNEITDLSDLGKLLAKLQGA